jgi:arginine decarboxylase
LNKRAPLFEALAEHARSRSASFHVPGHKFGKSLDEDAEPYYRGVMAIDATEIAGLDDLHHPEEAIREAQSLAAACFGAEETMFLVGGSTAGNLALITSVAGRGDLIIVQRNAHKSVLHGLMLAGAQAVFLSPGIDPDSGIAAGVRAEQVGESLRAYPEAKAVLLTNPNYYGMGIDLQPIAKAAHERSIPLLVDEAHGAHYGFHPELPPSALSCGADAVVQSTHKMLGSMTMSAMLHVQGNRVNRNVLKQRLAMLQSSSPSYPLMASLDLARRELERSGHRLIAQGLDAARYFRDEMERLGLFRILLHQEPFVFNTLDPFKITLSDRTGTLSGPQLAEELERRGCYPEMSDPRHVLLVFSLHSTREDAERAVVALQSISHEYRLCKQEISESIANIGDMPPFLPMSPPVSFDLPPIRHIPQDHASYVQSLPIRDAVGMRSAEMVIPYPPGIPIVYQGEAITAESVKAIEAGLRAGVKFQGSRLGEAGIINVFAGGTS